MGVLANFDGYKIVKQHADNGMPEAQLAVGEYLMDPSNWNDLRQNGLDPQDEIYNAFNYLQAAAMTDGFENAGQALKDLGDIFYLPVYGNMDFAKARHMYVFAAERLQGEARLVAQRRAVDCSLWQDNMQEALDVAQKMVTETHDQRGMVDFAEYCLDFGDANAAADLLDQITAVNSMEALFLRARLLCPNEPGATIEARTRDILERDTHRILDFARNTDDMALRHRYISILSYYAFIDTPAGFLETDMYKLLMQGAQRYDSLWCYYYLGMIAKAQMMQHVRNGNKEDAKNASDMTAYTFRYAADRGCRPAMREYTEYLKLIDYDKDFTAIWEGIVDKFKAGNAR